VPCYTAGKNAEAVSESCLTHAIYYLIPIVNIYCHATTRGKIREMKGIDVRCMFYFSQKKLRELRKATLAYTTFVWCVMR